MARKDYKKAPGKLARRELGQLLDGRQGKPPIWRDALYEHIARMVLAHYPIVTIAEMTGYCEQTIHNILRRKDFAQVYHEVKAKLFNTVDETMFDQRAEVQKRVQAAVPVALSELFHLVEKARSEKVRLGAITHTLGLAGHTPVEKRITADIPLSQLDPEAADKLSQAFRTARQDPRVVDAEVLPEETDSD